MRPLFKIGFVLVVLAGAAAVSLWSRKPAPQARGAAAQRAAVPSQRPLVFAQAAVLVHGERSWRAHAGVPLVVDVVIRNPLDAAARLKSAEGLSPRIRRQDGSDVRVSWTFVPATGTELTARGGAMLGWTTSDALPPGTYLVTVPLAQDVVSGAEPLGVPRVLEASLEILAGDASAEERALAQARMLQRTGDAAGALAALQAASGPDASLVLRLWTADALRDNGREAEANAEYARLAAESVAAQRARGVTTPEIPFWLAHAGDR